MGLYNLRIVGREEIDGLRSTVSPWLYGVGSCSRGANDLGTSLDLCKSGLAQLWVAEDRESGEARGAFLTDVRDTPASRKSVCIWAAGGEWRGMVDDAESRSRSPNAIDRFAVEQGADCIQFDFPIWARRLLCQADPGGSSEDIFCHSVLYERDLYRKEAG